MKGLESTVFHLTNQRLNLQKKQSLHVKKMKKNPFAKNQKTVKKRQLHIIGSRLEGRHKARPITKRLTFHHQNPDMLKITKN